MNDKFLDKLKETDSPEHSALLTHVNNCFAASKKQIAKNYEVWDENQRIFESRREKDREDRHAELQGRPGKLIVPLSFSQVMTFVAQCVMAVTQNDRFFELQPTGQEDEVIEEAVELILARDCKRNDWMSFLIQFFLDIGRFSMGCAEVCYQEVYRKMRIKQQVPQEGVFGTPPTMQETYTYEDLPVFIGNRVYPISPYRFYPDLSLPLTRYQEGEFCGSEDIFSYTSLVADSDLFNLDKIPKYSTEDYIKRKETSRVDIGVAQQDKNPNLLGFGGDKQTGSMVTSGSVIVGKMHVDLNPKQFSKNKDAKMEPIGDEDFTVRYCVWVANDKTVIRCEEAYYYHGMFPYVCAQYIPDQHNLVNMGLSDICDSLASLVTWKLNAHMASQKRSVESKYLIDPSGVNVTDLDSRKPYIFLKKNAAQTDVRRYVQQFITQDVTANVMKDVADLKELLEQITGNTAQMQGQYSQGRRSATQDRVVAQGASARGKCTVGGIWDKAFEPLGKQMLANNRQEMDFETFSRIMGQRQWPMNPATGIPYTVDEIYIMFQSTPQDIAAGEDFFVFDGTLPSEKAFLAQSLQEMFMQILANPQVAQTLGFDGNTMRELFNQIYILRGVTPARLPAQSATAPMGGAPPNLTALPPPSVANSGQV